MDTSIIIGDCKQISFVRGLADIEIVSVLVKTLQQKCIFMKWPMPYLAHLPTLATTWRWCHQGLSQFLQNATQISRTDRKGSGRVGWDRKDDIFNSLKRKYYCLSSPKLKSRLLMEDRRQVFFCCHKHCMTVVTQPTTWENKLLATDTSTRWRRLWSPCWQCVRTIWIKDCWKILTEAASTTCCGRWS